MINIYVLINFGTKKENYKDTEFELLDTNNIYFDLINYFNSSVFDCNEFCERLDLNFDQSYYCFLNPYKLVFENTREIIWYPTNLDDAVKSYLSYLEQMLNR